MCTVVELEDRVHGVVGPHRAVHVTPRADGRPEVLHLFSGPKGRSDGLAAHLEALGISVLEIDSGGETDHPDNLLQGDLFQQLLTSTGSGRFIAVVIGTPCSTFSVARFRPGGAPVVRRSPDEVRGIADPPTAAPCPRATPSIRRTRRRTLAEPARGAMEARAPKGRASDPAGRTRRHCAGLGRRPPAPPTAAAAAAPVRRCRLPGAGLNMEVPP